MMDRFGLYGITAVVVFLATFMLAVFIVGEMPVTEFSRGSVTIAIRPGESLAKLARRLHGEGVLKTPRFFHFYAVLRGDTAKIKAGHFRVSAQQSSKELLDYFIKGDSALAALTIPEGFSVLDIAMRIDNLGMGSAERFMALATNEKFIRSLDLPLPPGLFSLEGLLFPETYHFSEGVDEEVLIRAMAAQFKKQVLPQLNQAKARVGLDPYEALVLASVVEKETGASAERPVISAVFHNRLKLAMRLDSDPTVIYGIKNFDGNLTRRHLRTHTAYNTYMVRGLPPTPIANPGLDSILAAMEPANVDFLFFVSKGDGTHIFSKDLKSHNRAVYRYQKKRRHKRKS